MASNEPSPVGIAWYRPQDYQRLRAMCTDPGKMADTYEEWLEGARNLMGTMTLQGFYMVKVPVDPDAFQAWCQAQGLEMNSAARAQYARELVSRMELPRLRAGSTHKPELPG